MSFSSRLVPLDSRYPSGLLSFLHLLQGTPPPQMLPLGASVWLLNPLPKPLCIGPLFPRYPQKGPFIPPNTIQVGPLLPRSYPRVRPPVLRSPLERLFPHQLLPLCDPPASSLPSHKNAVNLFYVIRKDHLPGIRCEGN